VNDSAVCQYYEPRMLARGTEMTLTLCLGKYAAAGFALRKPEPAAVSAAAAAAPEAPEPTPKAPEPTPVEPTAGSAQSDAAAAAQEARTELATVNALLSRIDGGIAADSAVTPADIERLRAALAELRSRSSKYTASSGSAASGSTTSGK
jgi:hypothetical protein